MAVLDIILGVVKVVSFVYDVITFPVYLVLQQSWKGKNKQDLGKVVCLGANSERVSYSREKGDSPIYREIVTENGIKTLPQAFDFAVRKYGDKECLGTRQVLGEEDEMQKNGKIFKKLSLGDYDWISYKAVRATALSFGTGLRSMGKQPGSVIGIYAETRAEWMIACLGAFSQNISLATVYTNLGDDGVVHAINETSVNVVITSYDLLPKFKNLLPILPLVSQIIVMEDQLQPLITSGYKEGVQITPFRSVVTEGANILSGLNCDFKRVPPVPDDIAIIMYTSGSTGTPKGVELTHKNLMACVKCLMFMLKPKDDVYIAYLPLAHVLELMAEFTMMLFGIKVGYSSPNTMTDMSTKVREGNKGDASVLLPTLMCAVPLVMDRIYKNIMDSVKKKGSNFQRFFQFFCNYKLLWLKKGYDTPLLDKVVFSKIRKLLGGNIRMVLVGGAPLSPNTHDFIRVCLGCVVVQGYSLTESCCTGTVMQNDDLSVGTVGKAMTGVDVQLVDWEEGNYKLTDRPNPRGEIILGGDPIAKGYYSIMDKGEATFFELNGKHWVRTGDIGEFLSDGTLLIIDRKKDLVKLQLGEYVSLGKVEALLKTHPLVENICVYGDSLKTFIVALVVPSRFHLENFAYKLGKTSQYNDLLSDKEVTDAVLQEFTTYAIKGHLQKFEIPKVLTLVTEQWTPESGLITASFKMKRKVIQNYYQHHIDRMYS